MSLPALHSTNHLADITRHFVLKHTTSYMLWSKPGSLKSWIYSQQWAMIVTYLWVITSSDSIVYLILSTLVQCGIYASKSILTTYGNQVLGLWLPEPSINGWYHFPRIQKIPGQPVYAAQDHSWLMLSSAITWFPQGWTSANTLTGSSCSNIHLHIPMTLICTKFCSCVELAPRICH